VYGAETAQTRLHPELATRFDYDAIFGTVLNRFVVQAVLGHPLTVYGSGGQTRGFLNIVDTMRCLEIAASQPAQAGEFRVFNQFTESLSVLQLAELVATVHPAELRIEHLEKPRVEQDQHYYRAAHDGLIRLGLEPHPLSAGLLQTLLDTASQYRRRINPRVIQPTTRWRPTPGLQGKWEPAVVGADAVVGQS